MRALKTILVMFLVLIIIGGLGYIGWSMFFMPMQHGGMSNMPGMNIPPSTTTPPAQTPSTQPTTPPGNVPLNAIAIQNKDKLNQAIGTINQAIDLISIDPYAKATVPTIPNTAVGGMPTQPSQGTGTINIYPSGNSSVNIAPSGNIPPNIVTPPAYTNPGTMAGQSNTNFVYDQNKLRQLNNGIYTLSQGIMLINQLNEDLTNQTAIVEANPPNYQTFVTRYNNALQNRTKLNNAINMIDQASTLVNVNPYASPNGFQFNVPEMQRLHQGVYKLAQGMTMLSRLNEDFTRQIAQAGQLAQNAANTSMAGMTGTMPGMGTSSNINLTTIMNIVLVVMVIGLMIGIFGAIVSLFRSKTNGNGRGNSDDRPDLA